MGCKSCRAAHTRSAPSPLPPSPPPPPPSSQLPPPFPSTIKEQSAAFERELRRTCDIDASSSDEDAGDADQPTDAAARQPRQQDDDGAGHARKKTVFANPLALQLAKQYWGERGRLQAMRRGEHDGVLNDIADDKRTKRESANPGKGGATVPPVTTGDGSADALPLTGAAPTQCAYTVLVNESCAAAARTHFDAALVITTMWLFAGWVEYEVQQSDAALKREDGDSEKGGEEEGGGAHGGRARARDAAKAMERAASTTPLAPGVGVVGRGTRCVNGTDEWSYEMRLELHGTDNPAEAQLRAAEEDFTAALKGVLPSSQTQRARPVAAHADGGGKGVLFMDAVFTFRVRNSYDRRVPWQMELCFCFC